MDSSYKQTRTWTNSRGANNGGLDNWAGFQPGPGPERSSQSLAGWAQYENSPRRPIISNDMQPGPQGSAGTRWSHKQSEWNETRGGGQQAGLNLWSGSANGNPRVMQNQPQQQQQQQPVQMQSNVHEPPKGHADGFIQGFSNAGRDWFYRYMEMGCSPEEARDRVLERNRNHPESLDSTPHGGRYADAKDRRNLTDERFADAKERRNLATERYTDAKERRNPAEERRRPAESGSETLGNILNSFNGACRKWYNRHLENGFTPEEAIAKILEHRMTQSNSRPVQSSTDTDGRKRPVDSKARDDAKKPKKGTEGSRAETVSSGKSPKNYLAVSVVAGNYPKHYLTRSELTKIEGALLEEMKNGWTHSLNFGGIKYRPGMIVVTCLDEGSKEWLEQVVPKIAVQGVRLRIYKEGEVPDSKAITFYVPRIYEEPDDVTFRFVKEQNTDLLSGNWSIVRNGNAKPKTGKVMTLKIGDKSLDLLKKRGMTISYRFSQLPCHIARGSSSKKEKKKALDETIANPPEIDLTADDEEMELSDMTVLDEVQCDDDDENEGNEIVEEDANDNGGGYEQQCEEADQQ